MIGICICMCIQREFLISRSTGVVFASIGMASGLEGYEREVFICIVYRYV